MQPKECMVGTGFRGSWERKMKSLSKAYAVLGGCIWVGLVVFWGLFFGCQLLVFGALLEH